MNVVGKVGSLITQGVYSVATPFHPFGGAIDVIVVQQEDGTFRSTPWYVRFGKFQGVLKGAEKIVQINVNGIEADFHMYLDNSGEAYFVKEVDDDKGILSNGVVDDSNNSEFTHNDSFVDVPSHRLDHSISDTGVLQLKGEDESFEVPRLQRAESCIDPIFYEFQDEQPSFEDSAELSEYGSNQYESLDGEKIVNSQGPHPEVVLLSVDGHVLMAPVSESEQDEENLQLETPRLQLGPREGTGNQEFSSDENAWAADYVSRLDATAADVSSSSCCTATDDDNVSGLQQKVSQGEEGHGCQAEETLRNKNQDLITQIGSGEVASSIKRENVLKSSFQMKEFTLHVGKVDLPDEGSSLEVQNLAEDSKANCLVIDENGQRSFVQSKNNEKSSSSGSTSSDGNRNPNLELGVQEVENKAFVKEVHYSKQASSPENDCKKNDIIESQAETSYEGDQSHSGLSKL